MDVEKEIKVSRDKPNILRIGGLIVKGQISFSEVVNLIPKDEFLQQRASQVLIHTLEYHKYVPTNEEVMLLSQQLKVDGMIEGAYRNVLRTLCELNEYPEQAEGFLFDYSINALMNLTRPVAIRAFAIPIAFNIVQKYPDLVGELKGVLLAIPAEDGASIQSRKKKYLKKIDRLIKEL